MPSLEDKTKTQGYDIIVGIDEAGRAPLAGPVVACAVALKSKKFKQKIRDSKKLSPKQREKAFHEIYENSYVGVGIMNEAVIDQYNILEATFLAMSNAVEDLVSRMPASEKKAKKKKKICLLVDGPKFKSELPYTAKTIVGGDSKVLSISCASIVAKVIRDRILLAYDQAFPQYGFRKHKGYPTKEHKKALKKHGPSLIHRRSFKPKF